MKSNSIIKERQQPLMETYVKNPQAGWITDMAIIEGKNLDDPLHTSVSINEELKIDFAMGVHRAVGGNHDFPNSGDLLCASLASCFETVLRMVADKLHITLVKTKVIATAYVDVRGTLMMDKNVPVGFQSMTLDVEIKVHDSVEKGMVPVLLKATEKSCIILQTLIKGIPIQVNTRVLDND